MEQENKRTADEILIDRMVQIRKNSSMSQTMLGKITGTRQQVISRLEKKQNSPTLKNFCKVLDSLGCQLVIVKKYKTN